MELLKVAKLIEDKIKLLEAGRKELKERAENKAKTSSTYDKQLARNILMLKNSDEEILWQDQKFTKLPVTLVEKVAKGFVFQEAMDRDLADLQYRNACIGMNSLQAEISALQSINKHLGEM